MKKYEFTYPGTDLDRGRNLIALLGSFWANTYDASDQLASYTTATAETVKQTFANLLEVVAAISRYDVPVFHTELMQPVTLKLSEMNSDATNLANFDETDVGVFDGTLLFDRPMQSEFYAFPLPAKLVDVGYMFNKITFPTVALMKNADFIVDTNNNALVFADNPFENDGYARRKTDANDTEITLWAFSNKFDYDYVFEQFAYAVGIRLRSSDGYKELMNAVITGLIDGGAATKTLETAISAICGIPLALEHETVDVVRLDRHGLFIATDKTVYRFNENAEPVVVPGQVLRPGNYLVRGFEVSEFFLGNTYSSPDSAEQVICQIQPDTVLATDNYEILATEADEDLALILQRETCSRVRKDLSQLALDAGFLAACFWGELVFENREVPLEVITDHPSGYTYVKFGVGGLPADVEYFFDEIHQRGIARRQQQETCPPTQIRGTLAHVLDYRKNIEFEPTPETLPKTINPLRFLVENVLRNNVFVVRIIVSALGRNAIGLYNIRHLRALIPPQTAMVVVFELAADVEKIYPDKLTERIEFFTGAEPAFDPVPHTLIRDLGATARSISGTCQ
jgi:hypothetical protein